MGPRSSSVSRGIECLPSCREDEQGGVLKNFHFHFPLDVNFHFHFPLDVDCHLVDLAVVDVDVGDVQQTPAWTAGGWWVGSTATGQVLIRLMLFLVLMYIIIKGFNQYHLKRYGAWPRRILAAGLLLLESKLLAVVEVTCL